MLHVFEKKRDPHTGKRSQPLTLTPPNPKLVFSAVNPHIPQNFQIWLQNLQIWLLQALFDILTYHLSLIRDALVDPTPQNHLVRRFVSHPPPKSANLVPSSSNPEPTTVNRHGKVWVRHFDPRSEKRRRWRRRFFSWIPGEGVVLPRCWRRRRRWEALTDGAFFSWVDARSLTCLLSSSRSDLLIWVLLRFNCPSLHHQIPQPPKTMANPATGVSIANHHNRHRHVVAMPYPGRGHINPMLTFCKQIISKNQQITKITVIVTEEWLKYLNSEKNSLPSRITFTTIPNVLPSELIRGSNLTGFFTAVQRDMEEPVERVFDLFGAPPDLIIADSCFGWALDLATRRNVKMASFWTASVTSFLLSYHYELFHNFSAETGEERIEFIPGIRSIRVSDLPESFLTNKTQTSYIINNIISPATKAQCIIFRSLNELESPAIKALKTDLSTPTFTIGPAIPYFKTTHQPNTQEPSYITWLNSQQPRSVLYLSLGSFLSASSAQMNELAAGLKESGVPFLWAARERTCQLSKILGEKGMVVPWCDQMRVLCNSSVGGFFTHCGWNSVAEAAFAGVPVLTFPLDAEQVVNGKVMVEDWGIGRRMKDRVSEFVGREAVCEVLKKFMDLQCGERKELDRASKELQERLLEAVSEDGSTSGLDEFLSSMLF